jgi:ABC-type phosphate transport system substrate-binding protein
MHANRISPARKRRSSAAVGIRASAASVLALIVVVWCVAAPPALAQPATKADVYRIIVNPQNPLVSMDRELMAQTFLKKVTTWSHGGVVRPVDLRPDSPARRKFSEDVLGRSVAAVRSYWLQIIFAGRGVPPPELKSDDEVVGYVLKETGAIGYVSSHTDLHGARVLAVE